MGHSLSEFNLLETTSNACRPPFNTTCGQYLPPSCDAMLYNVLAHASFKIELLDSASSMTFLKFPVPEIECIESSSSDASFSESESEDDGYVSEEEEMNTEGSVVLRTDQDQFLELLVDKVL